MKIARKNTESFVLFLWIPVMWGGNTQHKHTRIYNSAWKDANYKKNYSQFAISWQKTRVSELIGNCWALPWVLSCSEMLFMQGGQNRQWHNWPQQAPLLCSCSSSLTTPFSGMDEKWIRQENGRSQNLQGNLCCLGHSLLLPRMITRGDPWALCRD